MEAADHMADGAFGRLLRYWRQVRKLSQEDIALEIDSSIKHISFLENGRSLPSRDMTLRIAEFLKLNSRETNNLLSAAGMSVAQSVRAHSIEEQFLNDSLIHTLRGLDPFPSVIINRLGDAHMMNRAWMEIIGNQMPVMSNGDGFNILDLIVGDDGLKPYMDDWEETVCTMLVFLQQEILMFQERRAIELLQRYLKDSDIPSDWRVRGANKLSVSGMYTRITLPGMEQQLYLQVFNTVGSARFMPEPALMIYTIYPQDWTITEVWRKRLVGKNYQHALLHY